MEELADYSYSRLSKLRYWLNYELSSSVLFLLTFLNVFFAFLLVIAAVVFAPLLLSVLYQEKKFGWIIFFFIVILFPFLFLLIGDYFIMSGFLSLGGFYFYCFMLKYMVDDWIVERRAQLSRLKHDDEPDNFEKYWLLK